MRNSFFDQSLDAGAIRQRVRELSMGKVGFYSVGLYPASLAYNCAMQNAEGRLLLAPRPGRDLLGAFPKETIATMDDEHVETVLEMGGHRSGGELVANSLSDLIERCDLVVLSANSNHIEEDLHEACRLRQELQREQVVLACLAGSFSHDPISNSAYVLCEQQPELAFFSGFHRHGRQPLRQLHRQFLPSQCPDGHVGAQLMDQLSPNIQVSAGVHNVEGQFIKAAKNMASVFAGFGYGFHQDNSGVLPTLLTLLLNQCLDQAATVSMARPDRQRLYHRQPFPLTELGYAVPRIESTLVRDGDFERVRDHTFGQPRRWWPMRGSMMLPVSGSPTATSRPGK